MIYNIGSNSKQNGYITEATYNLKTKIPCNPTLAVIAAIKINQEWQQYSTMYRLK
jgi:hypothetical protein